MAKKEYVVMHSKQRYFDGHRGWYINVLSYTPITEEWGIYSYYYKGEKKWSIQESSKLFLDVQDESFYKRDHDDAENEYQVFAEYGKSVHQFCGDYYLG